MESDRDMTVAEIRQALPPIQDAVIEELRDGSCDQSELVDRVSRKLDVYQQMVRYAILSLDAEVLEDETGRLLLNDSMPEDMDLSLRVVVRRRSEPATTSDMAIEDEYNRFQEAVLTVDRDGHTEAMMILRLMAAATRDETRENPNRSDSSRLRAIEKDLREISKRESNADLGNLVRSTRISEQQAERS